jgi:glucose/arabinose dehydrogenase
VRPPARKLALGCALLLTFAAGHAAVATAAPVLPPGFQDTELELEGFTPGQGLEYPTAMRFAPDGELFVAQKTGEVLRYENVGDKTPTTFADLRTNVFDLGDRGILGLALDPKFEAGQPYVYVLYTYDHVLGDAEPPPRWGEPNHGGDECPEPDGADDCLVSGRLVRFKDEGSKAGPEEVLVEGWCQQFSSHSIGDLAFGPEGDLYASGGDGASFVSPDYGQFGAKTPNPCGDPPAGRGGKEKPPTAMGGSLRSQNPQLLNGKLIRVDPETGEGLEGNPLFESANANERRLVGEGFRNPFRFAIDPKTHQLYVGNVGWGTVEEIDRFTPPLDGIPGQLYNSGWPCYEGSQENVGFAVLELNACEALYDTPGSTSPPFFSYEHGRSVTPEDPCTTEDGSAIAGLEFYEGEAFPAQYKGALFFSDPVRRCIYVMFPGEGGEPDPSTTVPFLTNGGLYPGIDVQEGPEGDLYYVKLEGGSGGAGSIHRISYNSGNQPPIAHLQVAGNAWGPPSEEFEFDASESSDEDPEDLASLEYSWDLNGDGKFSDWPDENTARKSFGDSKNHTVSVKVTDPHGASSVARVTVYPGDTPPHPDIARPAESLRWSVGETIHFKGSAADAEEPGGQVPEEGLSWKSLLFHCPLSGSGCHTHPLREVFGRAGGELIAPEHDYPTQIELLLTATDARGLAATTTLHLQPFPVDLRIESDPPGLSLTGGELTEPTPFTLIAVRGSNITLAAPGTAKVGGTAYAWWGWSDGGARVHTVLARCSATYTALYEIGTVPSASETTQLDAPCEEPPEEERPPEGSKGGGAPNEEPARPRTRLGRHPGKHSKSKTATFTFSSTEPHSHFRCKLDHGKFRACRSPRTYVGLKPGKHVFRVDAIGPSGLADKSPAKFVWRVT